MKLGVRGKLFAVSVSFILVAGLVGGLFLERSVRGWLTEDVERDLRRLVDTSRVVLDAPGARADDRTADLLGEATGARVTIIAPDGRVLGDSSLSPVEVAALENHGTRLEVREAVARGYGTARRYSTTLDAEMLYVAAPFQGGVVRAMLPLDRVERVLMTGRLYLVAATLLALALAVLVSALASHMFTRALRSLVAGVRSDDVGSIAGSFQRMTEELESTVTSLGRERERLETILEGMSEGVIALDAERRITLLNGAAVRLLALAAAPAGQSLLEVVRAPALAELLDDEPGSSAEIEVAGRKLLARVAALRAQDGVVVVLHDVTERRRLEGMRRDFVANVSHELRTPISVIRANTETLLAGAVEDPVRAEQFLSAVQRNADRLATLVADLLDLSRIEAGQVPLELRTLPAGTVVRRAADSVRALAREKGVSLDVEVPDDLRVTVDERAADQILLNLLDNAVKYTPNAGHVVVRARRSDGAVRVEVQDDGPGIDAHHRERVFERFYRVDPGRSREMGGTGLGLAIVKHLAEAMGGRVGVEVVRPHGSLFWVLFPAQVMRRTTASTPVAGSAADSRGTPRA